MRFLQIGIYENDMAHYNLDTRGLLCPLPVIKAQNKAKQLNHGDTVTLVATDPGARHDLPCWCRINGHKVLEIKDQPGEIMITFELIKD